MEEMEWTCTTMVYAQPCPDNPGLFCMVPQHKITIVAFDKAILSRFHFAKYRTLEDAQRDARALAAGSERGYFMIDEDWHQLEGAVHQ